MNILDLLAKLEEFKKSTSPQVRSEVYANGEYTSVTVHRALHPAHVELDSPSYVENKFKKHIPILECIGVCKDKETSVQEINVRVSVDGKFNDLKTIQTLVRIASAIAEVAEDKLSEPEIIKNIGLDCKPFIEDEKAEANTQPGN